MANDNFRPGFDRELRSRIEEFRKLLHTACLYGVSSPLQAALSSYEARGLCNDTRQLADNVITAARWIYGATPMVRDLEALLAPLRDEGRL